MICFPLDNTEYGAEALGAYLCTRTRGVFSAEANLAVTAASGMSVTVSPGLAWLKYAEYWGTCALQPQPLTLSIEVADGALARIDAVVCRLDKIQNRAEIIIKKGAYAASPTVVAPLRNDNYDEIYIATISVKAGTVALSAALITDQRLNETYCGLMRDGVTGIPTAMLQAQAQELIDQLRTVIAGIEQGSEVMLRTIYDPRGKATDIFAAIPGRNLLDNSDFSNPVNQRGATSYSGGGVYSIDRWKVYLTTLNVGAGSCTILRTGVGGAFYQYVIADTTLIYTFTAKTSDGMISVTGIPTENPEKTLGNTTIRISTFGAYVQISIWTVNTTDAVTLYWAKLEKGSVATPYVPKGYGVELAECLRYFQIFANKSMDYSIPVRFQTTLCEIDYSCVVPMRVVPSIYAFDGTALGRIVAVNSSGGVGVVNVNSINLGPSTPYRVTLITNYATTDISSWNQASYDTSVASCNTIALSADL